MSEQEAKTTPETETAEAGSPPEDAPEAAAETAAPEGEAAPEAANAGAPEAAAADAVANLEAQVADLNDKLLRALAETENVRRRAERDKQDTAKYAVSNFARDMLTVADNLRRALDAVDAEVRKTDEAVDGVMTGVEMTEREMLAAFERAGITRVDPLGQRFDSNHHEAMFEVPDESQPAGTVAQVVETGYLLHDRLLRPAKVGVTKGGPKPGAEATAEATGPTPSGEGQKAYEKEDPAAGGQLDEKL